jgi:hypothetical protein
MNWKVPKNMVDREERIRELEQEVKRLREVITKHRSHDRISGTDILRTAANQVASLALAQDLSAMADDLDNALDGGGDKS